MVEKRLASVSNSQNVNIIKYIINTNYCFNNMFILLSKNNIIKFLLIFN